MRVLMHGGGHDDGSVDDREHLVGAKAGLIVGIFAITLAASYVPFILGRAHVKGLITILSVLTCFSAGIILAGGFNHLLPGATEAFAEYFEHTDPENKYAGFPFAETLSIFVLFLLVALDKLFVERGLGETGAGHNHMDLSQHNHSSNHVPDIDLEAGVVTPGNPDIEAGVTPGNPDELKKDKDAHSHSHGDKKDKDSHSHGHMAGKKSHTDLHEDGNGKSRTANASQAWIFLIALSVHSIFDGLGLGAETNRSGFYGLLVAVLAHKMLDGFALGVPVYFAKFSKLQTAIVLVFCALMTPLGIGIGMGISNLYDGAGSELAKGIILSITCGSFFYISLIELLPSGLCQPGWLKLKLSLAFLGWAILAVLALWV
eukprot:gene4302-5025_t